MSEPKKVLNRQEAEHCFEVTMDRLESLQSVGRDVRPESSLPYIREQMVFNLLALMQGWTLPIAKTQRSGAAASAMRYPDKRWPFAQDPIAQRAFALMDAFDARDWTKCIEELRALREPVMEKFEP